MSRDICQRQAREYGRITYFLPLPLENHHFQRATVTHFSQISNPRVDPRVISRLKVLDYGHDLSIYTAWFTVG